MLTDVLLDLAMDQGIPPDQLGSLLLQGLLVTERPPQGERVSYKYDQMID